MSKESGFDAMIEACEIFKKYATDNYSLFNAEHDELTVDIDPAKVSYKDRVRLDELGFHCSFNDELEEESELENCFTSYRFGSC